MSSHDRTEIAATPSVSESPHVVLEQLVQDLAAKHPRLGLSFGYIGNCDFLGGQWDDRSWMVFAKLATWRCVGACDIHFGGVDTDHLADLLAQAQARLADWCVEQARRLEAGEIRIVGPSSPPRD